MQYGFVSQVTIATPRRQGRTSLTAPTTETRWKDAPGEGGGGEEGTGWRIGDGDGGGDGQRGEAGTSCVTHLFVVCIESGYK